MTASHFTEQFSRVDRRDPGAEGAVVPVSTYLESVRPIAAEDRSSPAALTIWGLSVPELHDAYWRARGVQCVRCGHPIEVDRSADLYLLLGAEQLLLFDIEQIIEPLHWSGAAMLRLQIRDSATDSGRSYRERVLVDLAGQVQRIQRQYRPATAALHTAMLTKQAALARAWMRAGRLREARRSVRRLRADRQVDRHSVTGRAFAFGPAATEQEHAFLTELVARWRDPDVAIAGIRQVAPGVWAAAEPGARTSRRQAEGTAERRNGRSNGWRNGAPSPRPSSLGTQPLLIGPIWLGTRDAGDDPPRLIVGPAWLADRTASARAARVRRITDIPTPPLRSRPASARGGGAHRRRAGAWYPVAKRAFDVLASSAVLLISAPLTALIAIAIIVDDGRPVLFAHRRQSRGGRLFNCLKFRTMRRGAERLVTDLATKNMCDGPQVFIQDDPRVTRVGRLLRTLHLDELPQFWNVLLGQMSVVGPRPSPDGENQYCPAWREIRLSVRPGITGLWQLKRTREPGRDFQEWIRYDIEYVRRAGFVFDLKICLQTARVILFGRETST